MNQGANLNIPRNHKDIGLRSLAMMFKDEFLPFTDVHLPRVKDVIQTQVPTIEVKDRGMDLNFLLEDGTIAHIEFESDALNEKDLIRFAHYDLALYEQRKQKIHRFIIISAGVPPTALKELDIGSVKQHHECIFLEHDFNGDEIYDIIEKKVKDQIPFTNTDKLQTMLLPMMKSKQCTISERALKVTQLLEQYQSSDEAYYLIGAMMSINYSHIHGQEKEKILEVLRMAKPFEDFYKEFELKGIEIGMKKGIEQGEHQGIQKVALRLLAKGKPIKEIVEVTGLSEAEIRELKNLQ